MKRLDVLVERFSVEVPKFFGLNAGEFAYLMNRASNSAAAMLVFVVPTWAYATTLETTDPMTEYGLVGIVITILIKDIVKSKTSNSVPAAMDKDEIIRRERVRQSMKRIEKQDDRQDALEASIADMATTLHDIKMEQERRA